MMARPGRGDMMSKMPKRQKGAERTAAADVGSIQLSHSWVLIQQDLEVFLFADCSIRVWPTWL